MTKQSFLAAALRKLAPRRLFLFAAVAIAAVPAGASEADALGAWRITRGVPAPWVPAGAAPDTRAWLGRGMRFEAGRVRGPDVLSCGKARYEVIESPPEGLFQGMLPAPAQEAADGLGLGRPLVPGVRLNCTTGVFDFHRADPDTLLVAVDNVVWTLSRAPGALADPASPGGVVQALLERHFAADMGFEPAALAPKRRWLSTALAKRIDAYFATPFPEDEPPPINGDPFTDSQEYPTRFAVGEATIHGDRATVPVRFADAFRERVVDYRLVREPEGWRVDELSFEDGRTLSEMLQ